MGRIFLFYTPPFITSVFICQCYRFQDCVSFYPFKIASKVVSLISLPNTTFLIKELPLEKHLSKGD